MTASFSLTLPAPISVNALFVNRSAKAMKGRMISPRYVAWRALADAALWTQKPLATFTGRVAVMIAIEEPKRPNDLDNKAKCILDFLVRHAIIAGDDHRYVRMLVMSWSPSIKGAKVIITEMV